ncbi:MAG: UxaA family hydrolase [Terriglobales bacterium]
MAAPAFDLAHVAVLAAPAVDNVAAVVRTFLPAGTQVRLPGGAVVTLPAAAHSGQSIALRRVAKGAPVVALGAPFGIARRAVAAGEVVDARNVKPELPARWRAPARGARTAPAAASSPAGAFAGFRRPDGGVGVRNYVAVVTSGMCAASEAREIARRAREELYSRQRYPNVDGVVAVVQESGCGMPDGRAVDCLNRLLAQALAHPNFGAALFIDLGCGKTCLACSTPHLRAAVPHYSQRVRPLGIQASGGSRRAIAAGLEQVAELLAFANQCRRQPAPLSALSLGVKCGGSDRWSGLTANPALGWAADRLVAAGGTVLIGEVPELQGAAHRVLLRRAASPVAARKLAAAQRRYQRYVRMFGEDYRENPSPGNIAGGLANIYLKSLGALAKSGASPLRDVLDYGEPAGSRRGLMVVYSPGYDQISTPALFLGGAQIVGFTTGRGTGIGCALGPVLKIASNSALARANEDIDLDAGGMLPGNDDVQPPPATLAQTGQAIWERILAVANGDYRPRAEASGIHDEFKVWESLWPAL